MPDLMAWYPKTILGQLESQQIISHTEYSHLMDELNNDGLKNHPIKSKPIFNQKIQDLIKSKGYDSIVYKNEVEGRGDSGPLGDSYIVFDPKEQTISPYSHEHLSAVRKASYQGQEVEVIGRRGNSVRIKDASGKERTVGFSELDKEGAGAKSEPPKGKYEDIVGELEALNPNASEPTTVGHQVGKIITFDLSEGGAITNTRFSDPSVPSLIKGKKQQGRIVGTRVDPTTGETFLRVRNSLGEQFIHPTDVVPDASQPKPIEDITIDPKDVSLVGEPIEEFPEVKQQKGIDQAFKNSVEKIQTQDKEAAAYQKNLEKAQAKEQEIIDTPVEEEGIEEDWLKTAAKEIPKIEKAQATEIIRDQPFRDQIFLQDRILKGQEQEALKSGNAEEANKAAMERKILRAQNAEEFTNYRNKQKAQAQSVKDSVNSVKETDTLKQKIEKEQAKEKAGKSPLDDMANHFTREQAPRKPSGAMEWIAEASNFFKTMRFSGDLGVPLRNARAAYLSHPIKGFGEFVPKAIQSFFSHEKSQAIEKAISARPNFKRNIVDGKLEDSIATKSGLKFHSPGFDPSAEYQGSYLAPKVPGLKHLASASERAAQASTNLMRAYVFDNLTKPFGEYNGTTKAAYEAAAKAANILTGRGEGRKGGKLEAAMPLLNTLTSSARLTVSKYQHAGMSVKSLYDTKIPANVRMEYLKGMMAEISVGMMAMGIAKGLGAEVDTDHQSPTFGQVKYGKTVWPVFGPKTSDATRLIQVFGGRKGKDKPADVVTGEKPKNSVRFGPSIYTDLFLNPNTGSGRASPLLSEAYKAAAPGDYAQMTDSEIGQLIGMPEIPSKALGTIEPMSVGQNLKLLKEHGLPGFAEGALNLLGENIDVRDEPRFRTKKKSKGLVY